jgi:hypothetical protein
MAEVELVRFARLHQLPCDGRAFDDLVLELLDRQLVEIAM